MQIMRIVVTIPIIIAMMVSHILAGGFQINEQNARAMGFAGAFVAQASDASAVYFNPAGLAFQKGWKVLGGTTFIIPTTTFTGPAPSTTKTSMESQVFYPSIFSFLRNARRGCVRPRHFHTVRFGRRTAGRLVRAEALRENRPQIVLHQPVRQL